MWKINPDCLQNYRGGLHPCPSKQSLGSLISGRIKIFQFIIAWRRKFNRVFETYFNCAFWAKSNWLSLDPRFNNQPLSYRYGLSYIIVIIDFTFAYLTAMQSNVSLSSGSIITFRNDRYCLQGPTIHFIKRCNTNKEVFIYKIVLGLTFRHLCMSASFLVKY